MDFCPRKPFLLLFVCLCAVLGLAACSAKALPSAVADTPTPTNSPVPPTATAAATPTLTFTATPSGCAEKTGKISVVSVPGKLQKKPTELRIYTPPCYSASGELRYSVVYMLHGQTYSDNQWQTLGLTDAADRLIVSRQIPALIIVMPQEASSMAYADNSKFAEVLINEVLPWVDANYATCSLRECRGIGGLSRGANWAVRVGLSYSEQFAVIGAHSAPLFYGDLNRTTSWIKKVPSGQTLPMIYLDFGSSDPEKAQMLQFDQELNGLGVPHQLIQFNGSHDADYWSAHVEDYLRWYSASLSAPQQ